MSVVQYVRPLPEMISTRRGFCTVGEQPAIHVWFVAAVTSKSKVLKLEPFSLRLPTATLHSGSSLALPFKCTRTFNFREIFKRAFKIYGIWPQARSVDRIHTHLPNAVPLVWGSFRLTPIILENVEHCGGKHEQAGTMATCT